MSTTETTPTTDTPTETSPALTGRARVRALLIEPLIRDGMIRDPRAKVDGHRATAADHAAFLDKLAERLAYMSADNLERLRQVCIAHAGGSARNHWPGWVTIRNAAFGFQTPPDPENPIMQSWLHSRRGPLLRDHGGLVETYLFLREKNRPPRNEYEEREIFAAARENARARQRVVEAIARDAATEDERQWLRWFDGLTGVCNDIVDAGIAHRRALGERE